jgi:chromosome segregation ATPase
MTVDDIERINRVSNGFKAVQIATEHITRTEGELEEARERITKLERDLAWHEGRLAEQADRINELESEKRLWHLRAVSMGQSVLSAAAVIERSLKDANKIVDDAQHEIDKDRPAPTRLPEVRDGEALDLQRS